SLRRARRAALRARGAGRPRRGPGDHGARAEVELARRRRRLLPAAALPDVALVAASREPGRPPPGDLLLPPVGTRPRATPRRGTGREGAVPSLPEPRTHGAAPAQAARGFSLGPGGSRVPEWTGLMESAAT